jgi:hypothetical protein
MIRLAPINRRVFVALAFGVFGCAYACAPALGASPIVQAIIEAFEARDRKLVMVRGRFSFHAVPMERFLSDYQRDLAARKVKRSIDDLREEYSGTTDYEFA